MSRHSTSPRARHLARAAESENRQRIVKASRGLFKPRARSHEREPWDTSSEFLDAVRGAINVAEEALGVRPDDRLTG